MIQSSYHRHAVEVSDLTICPTSRPETELITGISFTIDRGEMLGLAGESGSGKSLTGSAIAGLLPDGVEQIRGDVLIEGENLSDKVRPAMIFQNPMTSLNPSKHVGNQVAEAVRLSTPGQSRTEASRRAIELLDQVEISSAESRAKQYPFEFSGGMRQRVMIAMALAVTDRTPVLIADEPSTALDVTVQKSVMDLLHRLKSELGLAILLISHDLALLSERCDRLMVMYAGELVESGPVNEVLNSPAHPYLTGLMRCLPEEAERLGGLFPLRGQVPLAGEFESACRFAPRCDFREHACTTGHPELTPHLSGSRKVRCVRAAEDDGPFMLSTVDRPTKKEVSHD